MAGLGNTPMPDGFKYGDVFAKGRPRHQKTDPFRIRHPVMDPAGDERRGKRLRALSRQTVSQTVRHGLPAVPQASFPSPRFRKRSAAARIRRALSNVRRFMALS